MKLHDGRDNSHKQSSTKSGSKRRLKSASGVSAAAGSAGGTGTQSSSVPPEDLMNAPASKRDLNSLAAEVKSLTGALRKFVDSS